MDIVKEKIGQIPGILGEIDTDLWLVFVRETEMQADPTLPLVVGHSVVWQSFFFYTRSGEAIALVGNFDQADFEASGRFTEVLTYTEDVKESLLTVLQRFDPKSIAVNFSTSDVASDGLTHGMYLLLQEYLKGTPYGERLVSSEGIVTRLRARKLSSEIAQLSSAAKLADEIWFEARRQIHPGLSEKDIAGRIDSLMRERGVEPSFRTTVNAGEKSAPGHGPPTDAKLAPGDLLHVDFGVRSNGYCSDIQRLMYFNRPTESAPPAELTDAFNMVNEIITETAKMCKPGIKGYEIDAVAREMLKDNGYPEYQHALGHQLGRSVHDGGAILGPKWARYGNMPHLPLEEGNVFTLELEIILPGIGCVGLEEDICVEKDGGRFLCPRQLELAIR